MSERRLLSGAGFGVDMTDEAAMRRKTDDEGSVEEAFDHETLGLGKGMRSGRLKGGAQKGLNAAQ